MFVRRHLLAIAALVAVLLGCRGSSTPATCAPMRVHPVRFTGNSALTTDELRVPFASLERMELPWPTLATTAFDTALMIAVSDLRDLLADRGYVDAGLDTSYSPSPDRLWVDASITIREGERHRVATVTLKDTSGADPLVDAPTLARLVPLKPGDWYSRRTIEVGMSAVVGVYAAHGVGARAKAVRAEKGGGVDDVVIEVRRMPAIDRVASIDVAGVGSEAEERAVVGALGLRIGDRIDPALLEDAKVRVRAAGDFASVEVDAFDAPSPPGGREIDVIVRPRVPLPP